MSSMIFIVYPEKDYTEAEIQALLYARLKANKLDARLTVRGMCGGRKSLFDVVIFHHKRAVCIIECKSWSASYMRNRKWQTQRNSKQIKGYERQFGLPVYLCGCFNAIEPVTRIVMSVMEKWH